MARAARRMGRLRHPPAESHVPSPAGVQPARAHARSGASDRGSRGPVGRGRFRESLSDSDSARAGRPARDRGDPAGTRRLRGGRLHPGSEVESRRAASPAPRAPPGSLGRALPRARGARRGPVRLPVREPRSRSGRDALAPARPDLRVSVRPSDTGARARAPARPLRRDAAGPSRGDHHGRARRRAAHALYRPPCGRLDAGVRALRLRGLGRSAARRAERRGALARREGGLRAGIEDRSPPVRRALEEAVSLRDGLPPGSDGRRAASGGAPPHRVLSPAAHAGPPQVPGRQRARRRRVHRGHAPGGEGRGAAPRRGRG